MTWQMPEQCPACRNRTGWSPFGRRCYSLGCPLASVGYRLGGDTVLTEEEREEAWRRVRELDLLDEVRARGNAQKAPLPASDEHASIYARIAEASGRKGNDTPRTLALAAIRDGENWNDRRLPEMGRALNAALDEIDALLARGRGDA